MINNWVVESQLQLEMNKDSKGEMEDLAQGIMRMKDHKIELEELLCKVDNRMKWVTKDLGQDLINKLMAPSPLNR